jgi:hypothetical protein
VKIFSRVLLASVIVIAAFASDVQTGNFGASVSARTNQPSAGSKRTTYPYSGELQSHDSGSITLKGKKKPRVLLITPATRVLRNGSRTRLAQAAPGERVSGSVRKNVEGLEEAITVNLKGVQTAAR